MKFGEVTLTISPPDNARRQIAPLPRRKAHAANLRLALVISVGVVRLVGADHHGTNAGMGNEVGAQLAAKDHIYRLFRAYRLVCGKSD